MENTNELEQISDVLDLIRWRKTLIKEDPTSEIITPMYCTILAKIKKLSDAQVRVLAEKLITF